MNIDNLVTVVADSSHITYPAVEPFLPDKNFPELAKRVGTAAEKNPVYKLFRQLLYYQGLDSENYSTARWNPLGKIIKPGDKVLLKPNMVRHLHLEGGDFQAVVTHASLIRCVLDYVALALQGSGEITVGDAPLQSTDFDELVKKINLREVCQHVSVVWNIPVKLLDFRLWKISIDERHQFIEGESLGGDQTGYYRVDLAEASYLMPVCEHFEKYRVTFYDPREMKIHHNLHTNEYIIPKTVLQADVVINLPKLKTHRKVAITAALKNLVGINGHKDWLPHHRKGCVAEGGDEYRDPNIFKRWQTNLDEKIQQNLYSKWNPLRYQFIRLVSILGRLSGTDPYYEGSWYGNDTLWRTVLDLNRLLIYADKNGKMSEVPQRRCLTIVDAVIAGEGEGPMEPEVKPMGMLISGSNPVAVDAVIATLIGFDYKRIPIIKNAFDMNKYPLTNFKPDDIVIHTNDQRFSGLKVGISCGEFSFKPASGWKDHVECSKMADRKNST